MNGLIRFFIAAGSLNAFLAVSLGAFGAHVLKDKLTETMLTTFKTGVEYHFYHALGLFVLAFAASQLPESNLVRWSGYAMLIGILLFSGSLYLLSTTGVRWLGAITPLGGIGFLLAWLLLFVAAWQAK